MKCTSRLTLCASEETIKKVNNHLPSMHKALGSKGRSKVKKHYWRAGGASQVVGHLPCKHKTLTSTSSTANKQKNPRIEKNTYKSFI
jgi:hypothetical protein